MEINSLNKKLKQMQEKLVGLQQKQLQGDLARRRNALNKSKFNKFDHINMEIVSGFCKDKMPSISSLSSVNVDMFVQQKKPVCQAYQTDSNTMGIDHSH